MKKKCTIIIRCSILIVLLCLVEIAKVTPTWGKSYAMHIYPAIAKVLSAFSGIFPFSVGDLFIVLSIAGIIAWIIYSRKKRWTRIIFPVVEYLLWIYVWFYLAWGLNYSQPNFYQRTGVQYTAYSPDNFDLFLNDYINNLNESYVEFAEIDKKTIHREITNQFKKDNLNPGIHSPGGNPRVKTMMFSFLFSKMGITGYMGPFFCEFNVNSQLPVSQYPATYAHEFSHFLGITSEAEANFYAYLVCTRSEDPVIRFSGYLSVVGYVLNNAYGFKDKDEYNALLASIKPEILDLVRANRAHWQEKYSPLIGDIQSWIYELYLKGNKIPSGRKNYSEVVGLLISWQQHQNLKTQ